MLFWVIIFFSAAFKITGSEAHATKPRWLDHDWEGNVLL